MLSQELPVLRSSSQTAHAHRVDLQSSHCPSRYSHESVVSESYRLTVFVVQRVEKTHGLAANSLVDSRD